MESIREGRAMARSEKLNLIVGLSIPSMLAQISTVMICGIMTDFCINATVEAGFEHGLHMIVPAYANSTQDNEYMTREQAYHYYNEFLWPERYADCVPMDRALELLKK